MNKDIEINGNMNLGAYSPLELDEEQQLNELSNQLLANYMKKAKSQDRERQFDIAKNHAVDTINEKLRFKVRDYTWPDRAYFMFSIDYQERQGFIIEVYYFDAVDTRNNYFVYLTPENPLYDIEGHYYGSDNTQLGFIIKNMRAGERMKFKQLCQAANELNGNGEETKESEPSIRSMIREGLAELAGEQFTHQLGPDGDVVYGKDEQGFFVYTKNNLGLKYFNTVEEAEEYARKLYKAIRLRKNAERQEFDRQMSLDETAQKHLVDVMKRYTEGNATAEEANKAIMDLANSENGDRKVNESYAKDGNYTHFAVHKNTNKIVNGWDYHGYDPEELRMYKKDYFIQDLIDYELDPKQYTILTLKGCKARGIDPFDDSQWANGYELDETSGEENNPYYGERHDMENKKIENLGNMKWGNFKK